MNRAIIILLLLSLTACASTPIIDSRGGSGNIAHDAERQHDDLYTCKSIAEDNTNNLLEVTKKGYNWVLRPRTLWLMPELKDKKKSIIEACMTGRGHQILEWS
jgi:hypothetical protein